MCCCRDCNHNKAHKNWDEWFMQKDFFSYERYEKILEWMRPPVEKNLYSYRPRRNNCT